MAVRISRYVEPGAFIEQQVVQPVPAFAGLPRQICLIGEGETCKTVVDERVRRGFINLESVTVSGTPARFGLAQTSDSAKSTMQLFLNGDQQVADAFSVVGPTQIEIASAYYDSTGTYTFSYQTTTGAGNNQYDELTEDVSGACGQITSVGTFPGTKNYVNGTDYNLSNSGILWVDPSAATTTGSVAETYSGLNTTTFKVTVDGGSEQSITFSGFSIAADITVVEVASRLNLDLTGFTASDSSGYLKLTSDTTGTSSSLEIGAGTANSILGFVNGTVVTGSGKNPAKGADYYVTYKAARADTEYNRPILSTSLDQMLGLVGAVSSSNALALAATIVFEQKPPYVYHIQVKNTGTGIAAQDLDYQEAIAGAELQPDITDVVVLGHPQVSNAGGVKALVRATLRDHVVDQSSLISRAERVGWFGLAKTTTAGDGETAGTFVYVATNELQVAADSPGRGRFVLVGPSSFKKTFRLADGTAKQIELDSTYLAAGVCALNASFLSPSEGLLRKVVTGLDLVEEITKGDRDLMASNGVTLVYLRQGGNVVFDPVSTDLTSAEFREINVMNQKDNVAKRVRLQVDNTLVGVVPDDLAQFVFEVKQQVGVQLNGAISDGAIAPYQNDDGTIRNLDFTNDIIVTRRASDPTTYDFRYTFFVKFIAKRLFGTYSVSIPSGQSDA